MLGTIGKKMNVTAMPGEGVLDAAEKEVRYGALARDIAAVTSGEANVISNMASIACLLHHAFDHFIWTGFYRVDPENANELVVGPYQGTLGCLRIPFGRGVCGRAAATGETLVVENVHEFDDHITCDSGSNSEIVVPVRDRAGVLIAVLDVDSSALDAFDDIDADHLEAIVAQAFAG